MRLEPDRIGALLFLLFSVAYGAAASQIVLHQGAEHEVATARTFPLMLSVAGTVVSFILLVRPVVKTRPRSGLSPEWRRATLLAAMVLGYALGVRTIGFFLSGVLFLGGGFWLLGERAWKRLVLLPLIITAGFQVVLHGLLEIYLADPFLRALGIIR